MNNVINLQEYRNKKIAEFDGQKYLSMLKLLHKVDLLQEMALFNEELQVKGYTSVMCRKGIVLFTELLNVCQTPELNILCKQMLLHLGAKK